MHKYQPRVHVIRKECGEELSPVKAVPAGEGTRTFSFPETVFTTVTAYQNQQVDTADLHTHTHTNHIPLFKKKQNTTGWSKHNEIATLANKPTCFQHGGPCC